MKVGRIDTCGLHIDTNLTGRRRPNRSFQEIDDLIAAKGLVGDGFAGERPIR
jgi:hypothetical protein